MIKLSFNVEVPAATYTPGPDGQEHFAHPGMYDATYDVQKAGYEQGQAFDPVGPVRVLFPDGTVRTDVQAMICPDGAMGCTPGEVMGRHYGWLFDLTNPEASPDDGGFSHMGGKDPWSGQPWNMYGVCNVTKTPKTFVLTVEQD